jgi:hypothetical protein
MQGYFKTFTDTDVQAPFAAAVVIPTLLRPSLAVALNSVFVQDISGRIQVLIGVDLPQGDLAVVEAACVARPPHVTVQIFWPGYSTARRHGGVMAPSDGGALRAMLTLLANSRHVAYLDDDNWWAPDHLSGLRDALAQAPWAFARRWFAHPVTRRPICIDSWESVGPGKGMFAERFGGFVDPSCLMIDKLACPLAALRWTMPLPGDTGTADRAVFDYLSKHHRGQGSGRASVFYEMNDRDGLHPMRVKLMGEAYVTAGAGGMPGASAV